MITGNHRPKQASNLPEGHDEVPEPDERAVRGQMQTMTDLT